METLTDRMERMDRMEADPLTIVPPTQDMPSPISDRYITLSDRMARQENAMTRLRQDTARSLSEMRVHTRSAIATLRDDVHVEFKSVHAKLDALVKKVDGSRQRKLLAR